MLSRSSGRINDHPFRSTGLPDADFDLFMADVYEGDAELTDAELQECYESHCNRLLAEQLAAGGYRLPRVSIPFMGTIAA